MKQSLPCLPGLLVLLVLSSCGAAMPDADPPAEVSGLSAEPGNSQVTLSWTPPEDPDFASVEISFPGWNTVTVLKGTNSHTIMGLGNGSSWTFTVRTMDTAGNTSEGVRVSCTPYNGGGLIVTVS